MRNARETESEPGLEAGKSVPLSDRASIQKRMHRKALFEGLFHRAFLQEQLFNFNFNNITTTQADSSESRTKGGTPSSHLGLLPLVTLGSPGEHRPLGISFNPSDLRC